MSFYHFRVSDEGESERSHNGILWMSLRSHTIWIYHILSMRSEVVLKPLRTWGSLFKSLSTTLSHTSHLIGVSFAVGSQPGKLLLLQDLAQYHLFCDFPLDLTQEVIAPSFLFPEDFICLSNKISKYVMWFSKYAMWFMSVTWSLGPYLDLFFCCLHLHDASECLSYPKPLTCGKLCGKYIV